MSEELIELYSTRILGLAADIPRLGHLEAPEGSSKVRSPLCGSTVSVEVVLDGDKVSAFAQDVKACALGQAAAAIVGAHVIGETRDVIARGRDQLAQMLAHSGPAPDAPWDEFEVLRAAIDFPNRHPSILLSFDATLEAIADATE